MAWLLPELELGEEPELRPLEPELDEELDPVELEPVELDPVELVPDEFVPELAEEEFEEPVSDELDPDPDPVEDDAVVLCADPGGSAPARQRSPRWPW